MIAALLRRFNLKPEWEIRSVCPIRAFSCQRHISTTLTTNLAYYPDRHYRAKLMEIHWRQEEINKNLRERAYPIVILNEVKDLKTLTIGFFTSFRMTGWMHLNDMPIITILLLMIK